MSKPSDLQTIDALLSEHIGEALAEQMPEASARLRMKDRLMARVRSSEPVGTRTIRGNQGTWEPFAEGITRKVLRADDGSGLETALYRLQAGASFPPHDHTHTEECWVLEGDILVEDCMVHAGDMHIAEPGFAHSEVLARTDALLLIHSQVYVGPLSP